MGVLNETINLQKTFGSMIKVILLKLVIYEYFV